MGRESLFFLCFVWVLYGGTSGWNALPMGRESLFSCVLFGFCTVGRQDGMLCLWVVSRFFLVFCLGFVRSDVRMEIFAYGS